MRYKLKVRRGAKALVMLIGTDLAIDEFAVCRCEPRDFKDALRYAQSRVALPTFLIGGDFAIECAEHVLDLRGIVAFDASDETIAAASRLEVPLLLIGGSQRVAAAARDASRVTISDGDGSLAASVATRFVGVYS
ncbi:MAG TPA: hypothetical protein VJ853_09530 [Thermoanaerobaculia bacterium]|nr:hypothetical protein [Thermoanaerobaculia bacterium]